MMIPGLIATGHGEVVHLCDYEPWTDCPRCEVHQLHHEHAPSEGFVRRRCNECGFSWRQRKVDP